MEITQVITALRGMNLGPVEIMPLHAQLSSAEQKRVFNPTSTRKIVVATNVAETSITIEYVTCVLPSSDRVLMRSLTILLLPFFLLATSLLLSIRVRLRRLSMRYVSLLSPLLKNDQSN
jgi:hypothetical protein